MANPQRENGHVDIANEIMEALAGIRISGEEWQCLCVIFRKTYGWHKKEDWISLSQFNLLTKLKKPNILRAIKKLSLKKVVVIKNDNRHKPKYKFNKNYEHWKPLSKKITSKSVIKNDKRSLSKMIPTKENYTKENYSPNSDEVRTAELLFNLILERHPNHKKPDIQKWALHINRMIRLDSRSVEDIEKIIKWCQNDEFWRKTILSAEKLRKQFDTLWIKSGFENRKRFC
jgi:phage replication O-like protein O